MLKTKYKEQVNPEYVKIMLESGFHYSHKAGKREVKDIPIPFPLIKQGDNHLLDLLTWAASVSLLLYPRLFHYTGCHRAIEIFVEGKPAIAEAVKVWRVLEKG